MNPNDAEYIGILEMLADAPPPFRKAALEETIGYPFKPGWQHRANEIARAAARYRSFNVKIDQLVLWAIEEYQNGRT